MSSDDKIIAINNLITDYYYSGVDMLVSTERLLNKIRKIIFEKEQEVEQQEEVLLSKDRIIISCDASITENPGGQASIGVVIRFPDKSDPIKFNRLVPSKTNNEAEYDAVYEALVFIANTVNRPKHPIVIRSDSQLVVNQLNGKYKINDPTLQRKATSIHELASQLPVQASIEWMPRNSTPDLEAANNSAQTAIGVPNH